METLVEFADDRLLETLIIKERVKCSRKYAQRVKSLAHKKSRPSDASHPETEQQVSNLDLLTSMMPSRNSWVHPKNRAKFRMVNGKMDHRKLNTKALQLTFRNELKEEKETIPAYLENLKQFKDDIRQCLSSPEEYVFHKPLLNKIFKKEEIKDGQTIVTYRPLAVYTDLRDKIILSVTSRYLMKYLNRYLHDDILSYRSARNYHGKKNHVTDFNDGILQIRNYHELHAGKPIYVADCDIMKFYDSINHEVVTDCFQRMLPALGLNEDGISQVMKVLKAYLRSYNFYENVLQESQRKRFWNEEICKRRAKGKGEKYQFGWVKESDFIKCYGSAEEFEKQRRNIGVPQGGALSLMIANVVLNDVDRELVQPKPFPEGDPEKLFIRFCDDMALMHTQKEECERLINTYCQSLTAHKLIYHPFTEVEEKKDQERMTPGFWDVKSHSTFLWEKGEGNASEWVGFLGYEMNTAGEVRLRKSNEQKFAEKLDRLYKIMLRMMKQLQGKIPKEEKELNIEEKHELTQLLQYFDKSMAQIIQSIHFYKGLDGTSVPLQKQVMRLDLKRSNLITRLQEKSSKIFGNPLAGEILKTELQKRSKSIENTFLNEIQK